MAHRPGLVRQRLRSRGLPVGRHLLEEADLRPMITVSFNAFLSLRPKLDRMGTPCPQSELSLADGTTVLDLTQGVGLDPDEVEAAFVNGRVLPKDTVLKDGDRVALVPPGIPGPHRYLLGISGSR